MPRPSATRTASAVSGTVECSTMASRVAQTSMLRGRNFSRNEFVLGCQKLPGDQQDGVASDQTKIGRMKPLTASNCMPGAYEYL